MKGYAPAMTTRPVLALSIALALCDAGCVTEGKAKPAAAPASMEVGALVPIAGDFADTDANHYRDTTRVVVYLYADSNRYPLPIAPAGSFEFRLENAAGKQVALWTFDQAMAKAARRKLSPGPGFVFDLSLLKLGSDRLSDTEGELVVTFTPVRGKPVRSKPSAPLLIGPLTRGS